MKSEAIAPSPAIVGRVDEQRRMSQALRGAAAGSPCAIVVHGEAGVGKTRLVREVVARAVGELGATVRWGTCVHFGASSVPFAALLTALRPDLAPPDTSAEPVRMLSEVDRVVNALTTQAPTVLVVDDLHWADVSSLDTLSYLVAGFRGQRLALLATCRDENRPDGHPLHGWLADMRRMPGFSELSVPRLDLEETAALVSQLQGSAPDLELAARVRERSGGNAYLTELLASGVAPGAHDVSRSAPQRLREALTATWHRLDAPARAVTRLLAVGGRPVRPRALTSVARSCDIEADQVRPALESAEEHGIVRTQPDGSIWFRHPLLAEVLYDGIPPDERHAVHTAFADVLEVTAVGAAADLAVHHEQAGHLPAAYGWSLAAANEAAEIHASAEEAEHLVRACRLWPAVTLTPRGSVADRIDLLVRTSRACRRVIRYGDTLRLLEEARALVDVRTDPLASSRLLTEWCDVTWSTAGPRTSVAPENHDAVRLTDDFPHSAERSLALSRLAMAEYWDGDLVSSTEHADEALAVSRRSGSDEALTEALLAWAAGRSAVEGPDQQCSDAVEEALRVARRNGDVDQIVGATIWLLNLLEADLRIGEAATIGQTAVSEALGLGDRYWCHFVGAMAAEDLLAVGRPDDAGALLREGLAARCVGVPGAATRLAAADLALYRGELAVARQHFDRALEVVDPDFGGLWRSILGTGTTLLLAEGDPAAAVTWLGERARLDGEIDRDRMEAPVAAMVACALADLARKARDEGDVRAEARVSTELDTWADLIGLSRDFLENAEFAWARLDLARLDAELARCRRDPDEIERWAVVVDVARTHGVVWEEGAALWRMGEAAVAKGAPRTLVASTVRTLHTLARDIGAHALRERAEQLARAARISLATPRVPEQKAPTGSDPLAALTRREREVLGHLAAGRTYAEIAGALVISEKTVSVHVSNILRKTGTSSRAEAAAWAGRVG